MENQVHIPYVREVLLFLFTAGFIVPLLQRKISPIIAFFIVGSVIGPYGLGLLQPTFEPVSWLVITDREGVALLAELGVIFLLFVIGLELSFQRLWAMRRLVFGLGGAQVLVTATVIAVTALLWGNAPGVSIILGACLALSSTAIVTQLLMESGRLGSPTGRVTFSILLMQDLAVVPILFAVSVLGTMATANLALGFGFALIQAIVTIALIYGVGRLIIHPALHIVASTNSREAFVAIVLLLVIGTAVLTGLAGLSMALGAFLAGLLVAETEFRHQVKIDIEPFKGLMMGLFFLSVGMGVDWRVVLDNPFWILASALGLVALKIVIIFGLCLLWRLPRSRAAEAAIMLGQAGEFGFLVVGLSITVGLLSPEIGQFMLIVVGLTMLATPVMDWLAKRAAQALQPVDDKRERLTFVDEELEGHVIIAGYGRVGKTIAGVLNGENFQYIAIDRDPAIVKSARAQGRPVRLGDASMLPILRDAGLDRASAVVVTIADEEATAELTAELKRIAAGVPIFARARNRGHAQLLLDRGATKAVPETTEGSLRLAELLLIESGIEEETASRRIELQRALFDT